MQCWHAFRLRACMLSLLDHFLTVFHMAFVLFILFGWMNPITRKTHVTALLLTVIAWLPLGLYKGVIGYCPLTDWHWDVKRALGETNLPTSFIEYMVEKGTGINFPSVFIDTITALGLMFGIVLAIYYHSKEQVKNKREKAHHMA